MRKSHDFKKVIGAWLKDLRQRKGLTQEQLADRIQVSSKYYSEIERGLRNITINTLQRIMGSLDMTVTDLIDLLLKANISEESLDIPNQITIKIKRGDKRTKKNISKIVEILLED